MVVGPAELRRRRKRLIAEAAVYRLAAEHLADADDPIDPVGYLNGIANAKTAAASLIDELLEAS